MGAQRPDGSLFVEFEEINRKYWSFLNYNGQCMKPFLLLFLGIFWSEIAAAQYPFTNYWFIETGSAIPLMAHKQSIYKSVRAIPIQWSPSNLFFFNVGGHLESMEGRFIELYFQGRYAGQEIYEPKSFMGLKIGGGKNRWRWFTELNYGSRTTSGGRLPQDEAAGIAYGLGLRYRLTTRMSAQASFLRNHFSQYFRVEPPYKHPVRSFVTASLYWNLNIKSDKPAKAPKVKKLTSRRQNRCLYSPSNT